MKGGGRESSLDAAFVDLTLCRLWRNRGAEQANFSRSDCPVTSGARTQIMLHHVSNSTVPLGVCSVALK